MDGYRPVTLEIDLPDPVDDVDWDDDGDVWLCQQRPASSHRA